MVINIAINGLGRIGRVFLRSFYEYRDKIGHDISIVHINGTMNPHMSAHLIKHDSTFGNFNFDISHDEEHIIIDNLNKILITQIKNIEDIDWTKKNVDIVIECSGLYKKKSLLSKHIDSGAKKVIICSPVIDADKTIVFGVNEGDYNKSTCDSAKIISISSCTTNCAAPILKLINNLFEIEFASLTTVHSYTNDQRLLDSNHKDMRRARSASKSIIPTTTGSSKEISKLIPELKDRLLCNALRVPIDCVSAIDMTVKFKKCVKMPAIIDEIKRFSLSDKFFTISFTEEDLVSIDFLKSPYSSVVDLNEMKQITDSSIRILSWYDNEYGFCIKIINMIKAMQHFINYN